MNGCHLSAIIFWKLCCQCWIFFQANIFPMKTVLYEVEQLGGAQEHWPLLEPHFRPGGLMHWSWLVFLEQDAMQEDFREFLIWMEKQFPPEAGVSLGYNCPVAFMYVKCSLQKSSSLAGLTAKWGIWTGMDQWHFALGTLSTLQSVDSKGCLNQSLVSR